MMAAEAQASQQQQQQQQQAELVLGKAAADASTAPGAAVSVVSAQGMCVLSTGQPAAPPLLTHSAAFPAAGGPPGMQGAPGPHGAAGAAEPSRKRSHADMAAVGEQSGEQRQGYQLLPTCFQC
jgi:hypothetical protein